MADEDLIAYVRLNNLDIMRAKELLRLAWAEDKTGLEKLSKITPRYVLVLFSLAFLELIYLK